MRNVAVLTVEIRLGPLEIRKWITTLNAIQKSGVGRIGNGFLIKKVLNKVKSLAEHKANVKNEN